ncbi:MAG: TIM-barrel domain-containing protein [Roseiflexaceae bacterium]
MALTHFQLASEPQPDSAAVVRGPAVRFTVLTSRLIRLEYSATEEFEDRPSQAFWYRRQPVPHFQLRQSDALIEIETDYLHLRYVPTEHGFMPGTLSIHVKATDSTWFFGDHIGKSDNLRGTTRTLDVTDGYADLDPGLMARSGWAIVDDSRSLIFDPSGWLTSRTAPANFDLYFFGYGLDYVACLQDFQKVAGTTPLIPRWALGNWWSRFWAYTQDELQTLMESFEAHQVPLSVCIVDMDWHITQTGSRSVGWTGYTWNTTLFPDPQGFIKWLHAKGLKTALNLHPADGVFPHEAQYQQMAAAMGIDPESSEAVGFDIANPAFADAYFTILHHPHEADGVDFWWLDWQQGTQTKVQGLDPLGWLNHLHFHDLGRDGRKRPFIFSRWGGLGNHRYPIGFSGDTVVSWKSLAYQPYFTATAANVGYGWWSHDIGGHMWGIEEAELYTRWVQYGVFSPILRLHSTNNRYSERCPWGWGLAVEQIARDALQLRHALIPYMYTMAWRNVQEGVPLVTPLYYSHPEAGDAYECPQAYWFGSEMLAAPFTAPASVELGMSRQPVWLPEGDWFNFFTGQRLTGGWQVVYGDLSAIPVFAKAGAIIPLGPNVGWGGVANPETLIVHVFAGADNRFALYEDDGETTDYQRERYALTVFEQHWGENSLSFGIAPATGDTTLLPARRTYNLVLHGIIEPEQATLTINGQPATPTALDYDAQAETLAVVIDALTPADTLQLLASTSHPSLRAKRDRRAEMVRDMLRAFKLDTEIKADIDTDLPRLLSGEIALLRYRLSDAQASALAHILGERTE